MAIDVPAGEVEVRRVKESEVEWTVLDGLNQRNLPAGPGERWVYDRKGDTLDRDPGNHEWVLLGPEKAASS